MFKNSKFIIVNDCLYLGRVNYHKDLIVLEDKNDVKGGGWFEQDNNWMLISFHGTSEDFGSPKLEDIKKCIEDKKIFWFGAHNISDKFTFIIKDGEFK